MAGMDGWFLPLTRTLRRQHTPRQTAAVQALQEKTNETDHWRGVVEEEWIDKFPVSSLGDCILGREKTFPPHDLQFPRRLYLRAREDVYSTRPAIPSEIVPEGERRYFLHNLQFPRRLYLRAREDVFSTIPAVPLEIVLRERRYFLHKTCSSLGDCTRGRGKTFPPHDLQFPRRLYPRKREDVSSTRPAVPSEFVPEGERRRFLHKTCSSLGD
uniref:Uncharacterized protein n=1 Tax=Timema shepardi TaxID=629360 RepID=A0A7R9AQ59_TIMSH|nr:unnamed protein product [Timema shepardi]